MKNIYWHTNYDSRNVDINISFSLKEYPSDLTTIYAENIIFTFKDGWTPHKQYLNSAFDIQTGDPKRFAFHLDRGSNTGNLGIFSPPTLLYYYKDDALLNVDEWIKRDSCPFKKIQLQGLSANTKFELPDTLDIPFPCDLEYVKVCLEHDTVYNACMKWASKE